MIFNIGQGQAESASIKERPSELLSYQTSKLTVSHIGKTNQILPTCIQCSQPARPIFGTYIYYFEVQINNCNSERPGIVVGLTEESYQFNKFPGSSRRSFGLRSDGKLLHALTQAVDFSPKLKISDIIGCGIMYISKKIFFTLNGSLLGRPFDLLDSYPIFASSAISAYQDSITFNFTSPFKFNLELLISEENHLLQTQINEESLHISEVYKLVYEYLEYQGYADTLKSLQEHMGNDRPVLSLEKSRSYSSRFSERYDSIDIGPDCQTCQTYERICKVCLKKIMQNVEPSSNIRLPESRNRCDSVDLASLYLKPQNSFIENTQVQCTIDAVKKRGMLRDVILTGNMKEAVKFISLNFPELLTDETCMLFINVQEFIEIVKSGDFYAALEFAREKLAEARNFKVFCRNGMDVGIFVWEVVGLIAYTRPQESPLAPLLKLSQLELTADLVNSRILQKSGKAKCSLEEMLKEAIATQYLFQENILMAKSPSITLNI